MRRLSTAVSRTALFASAAGCLLASCATRFAPDTAARAPRLERFGSLQMQVTTRSPEAQELFTRGMLQAYGFNQTEAVRSFKAALAADPGCALCALGRGLCTRARHQRAASPRWALRGPAAALQAEGKPEGAARLPS